MMGSYFDSIRIEVAPRSYVSRTHLHPVTKKAEVVGNHG